MSVELGMDIGGSSVKLGAWRGAERLAWRDGLPVPADTEEAAIGDTLATYVRDLAADLQEMPAALGIGSCGLIAGGAILQSPNTAWDRLSLVDLMRARLTLPVFLLNDADAFLLAALDSLDTRDCVALGITLGTGVGTAVWLRDRLLAGGAGISPEAGHTTVNFDRPPANTGIPGSWESLACRDALLQLYRQAGGDSADPQEIAKAARRGDAAAREAWQEYGRMVGIGLGSLCNIFSPHYALIGGGLAGAFELYKDALLTRLDRHMLAALPRPELHCIGDQADLVARGSARFAAYSNM